MTAVRRKARTKPNAESERRDTPKSVGLDFHRSPVEAVPCLIRCEGARLRNFKIVHEMACGDGALVIPLRRAGFRVVASDIADRGCPDSSVSDYLGKRRSFMGLDPSDVAGVTNPPFNRAEEFILRACHQYDYVAMVLRLRYLAAKHLVPVEADLAAILEMTGKTSIWASTRIPFARVIIPDGRWSMMHRDGYDGPKTESGMIDFCWFIWDAAHKGNPQIVMEAQLNAAAAAGRNDHA